jgi:hypothetical protein
VVLTEPDVAVIVAVPSATEVTSPEDDTVAIDELDVAHATVGPGIVLPPASFTVATKDAVSPMDVKLKLVGASSMLAASLATLTVAVANCEPTVAVIVAVPPDTPVTSPAGDTVATDELDVAHVTVGPGIVLPPASFTVATIVAVSPYIENVSTVGDNSILAAV